MIRRLRRRWDRIRASLSERLRLLRDRAEVWTLLNDGGCEPPSYRYRPASVPTWQDVDAAEAEASQPWWHP